MVIESWKILWERAMVAIDSLTPAFKTNVNWSFGGGTALRLFYDHRESKDIDIFVTDPYVISGLSPRLNGVTERLTGDYSEQSNYLKLRFPEGEVDFIIGARIVGDVAFADRVVLGRPAKVETPIEIVAKKCFYRADHFTARDIFDLAVVITEEPQSVKEHRSILLAKRRDLERRLNVMRVPAGADVSSLRRAADARRAVQEQIDTIAARPGYESLKNSAIDTVFGFIEND
jgi:predicted nucleotidyltransferase component of viral defense system